MLILESANKVIMDHLGLMAFILFCGVLCGLMFHIGLTKLINYIESYDKDDGESLYNYKINRDGPSKL